MNQVVGTFSFSEDTIIAGGHPAVVRSMAINAAQGVLAAGILLALSATGLVPYESDDEVVATGNGVLTAFAGTMPRCIPALSPSPTPRRILPMTGMAIWSGTPAAAAPSITPPAPLLSHSTRPRPMPRLSPPPITTSWPGRTAPGWTLPPRPRARWSCTARSGRTDSPRPPPARPWPQPTRQGWKASASGRYNSIIQPRNVMDK